LVSVSMVHCSAQTTPESGAVSGARPVRKRPTTPAANWTPDSFRPMELIKGAPFSAVKTVEGVRLNSEGRRVPEIRPPFRIFRDSEGRVRKEAMPMAGLRGSTTPAIEIEDPVAGARYALDSSSGIAHRIKVPVRPPADGRVERTAVRPAPGPNQPRVVTENLGSKEIDGIKVDGTKTTVTWPAGTVGNDKPKVITSEKWVAPDLKLVVLWRSSDPDSSINESLTNIERKEPDPTLFTIPSDYKIVDDEAPRPGRPPVSAPR